MLLAAQLRTLTVVITDFFRTEPGVTDKTRNRILLDAETVGEPGRLQADKLDIVLKGLLPVAVAAVGYFGTSYLSSQQRAESTRQFYTSLQAQRETGAHSRMAAW